MTYRTMCETMAEYFTRRYPEEPVTAEAIWHSSPTGEIWPIHALWEEMHRDAQERFWGGLAPFAHPE